MNPVDATRLGLKSGDTVRVSSLNGAMEAKLKVWEGVRPGTVTKCYGQGHWAYGRVAAKAFGKTPRGGSNNDVLVDDYDRLSGATARNGGFTGVRIEKV
jgi:anaerobic selenocysteine-containing dehydrogenase